MGYYIDLKEISIDQYKEILRSADLLPSWLPLRENIDQNLNAIKEQNVQHLDDLLIRLKTKSKIKDLAALTGLSESYLALLRRVVAGYRPKPNRIQDFPQVTDQAVEGLQALGIRNTLHLYPEVLTQEKRTSLSDKSGIKAQELIRLTHLTDLSRIKWVNHTFAHVLLETGYDTAKKVADADYLKMYNDIRLLNQERRFYNAHIGPNDMKRCIAAAKTLSHDIEY